MIDRLFRGVAQFVVSVKASGIQIECIHDKNCLKRAAFIRDVINIDQVL